MHAHCPTCGHDMPDEITIDWAKANVIYRGKVVHLTPQKITMLEYIIDAGARGITKGAIHDGIYGDRPDCDAAESKIIDVYVCQIRNAFHKAGIEVDFKSSMGRLSLVYGKTPLPSGQRREYSKVEARV